MTSETPYGAHPEHRRPTWDEYFIEVMHAIAKRGSCDRGRMGAVIVVDKQLVATGYVSAPAGCKTCDEVGHLMQIEYDERGGQHQHCVRTTHGEANAIAQAARKGVSVDGGTVYTTMTPCLDCAKLLINAGIRRVVAERRYHADHDSVAMLAEAGVELVVIHDEELAYDRMR